jgi:uncharacterized Fe-S cluster-containing radical SAM superfamily enzyme
LGWMTAIKDIDRVESYSHINRVLPVSENKQRRLREQGLDDLEVAFRALDMIRIKDFFGNLYTLYT